MKTTVPSSIPAACADVQPLTVAEARKILKHPVFGDERCIEARDLLLLVERVEELRERCECPSALPDINSMTAFQLKEEIYAAPFFFGDED